MLKKKILSTLLALCMLIALAPTLSIPAHAVLSITNISSKTLTPLVVGYTSGTQETATYSIKNGGDVPFTTLAVTKDVPNPESFTITQTAASLACGATTSFTVTANDGLAVGTYSVYVRVIVNGGAATGCTVTQVVSAAKGDQAAPNMLITNDSHYNANDGRISSLTTAMEYKLSTDINYTPCTGTEVTGLAPGIYDVRYKETASLNASSATSVTIDEIAGGLTAALAPLSPVEDNKMLLTITEDARVLDGTIFYMITDDISFVGETTIGDDGEILTSEFNTNFHEYTAPVEIDILDSYYVVAFKLETTIDGVNTDTIMKKCGASSAANDEFTQEAPAGLTAVPAVYGSTTGEITGTTTAMEYKLKSEDEKAYQDCADTMTTGLEVGTYVVRYKHTEDETESPTVEITIKQYAGGLTATLAPLSPAQDNKMQLTITEDSATDGITYYFVFNADNVDVPTVSQSFAASKRVELSCAEYTAPITITIPDGSFVYAVKGTLDDTDLIIYKFGKSIAASDGYTAPTGGSGGSTPASNEISGTVGDTTKPVGTAQDTTTSDGKSETIVKIDQDKIDALIKDVDVGKTIIIPTNSKSDIVSGQLNGQTVKNMEAKEAVLELRTGNTTYTLPASQINIDSISEQIGKDVALKDITVSIKISDASSGTAQIVADTANKGNYQLVVKPVEFEITCTSGSKTVEVSKFNGYVERTVAIPEGIDPSKITTGIVLNKDGTFSHVPTTIIKIDGKYYAKINSLTNSTYSVIYNPIEFADVANHWAKTAINDMGSRMVVTGTGNNTYEPDRSITRAEFAAVVVRALGLQKGTTESAFGDVSLTDWFNGYVDTATAYALIKGYDSTSYGPNDTTTREQAMAIIARAMKLTGLSASVTDSEVSALLTKYADGAAVSDYAKTSAAICLKTGVVTGTSATTLSPKAYVTRADVAVMVQKLLQKSGLI